MLRNQLPRESMEKAALLASRGKKQTEIATALGVSGATVHRLLGRACEAGILEPRAPLLKLPSRILARLESELVIREALLGELKPLSGDTLQQLKIFDTRNRDVPHLPAAAAGHIVDHILPTARNVAVTWGQTIRELVSAICDRAQGRPDLRARGLEFLQGCGDPDAAVEDHSQRSASLVAMLNNVINGKQISRYTFSMSASIPSRFSDEEVRTIRKFIRGIGGYSSLFDERQRLKVRVDTLITSCGNGQLDADPWLAECAKVAGSKGRELEALVLGNIGGYWLPDKGLHAEQRALLKRINDCWNGIVAEDMAVIAKRRPGVVLVAAQAHKAEIVLHLVKEQYVSVLLISDVLAEEIEKIIHREAPAPGPGRKR